MLDHPSPEQQHFADVFAEGSNIICDAIAGGAKTTTSLHVVDMNPEVRFLILTYNTTLAADCRSKLQTGATNSHVYTYHAAMSSLYCVDEAVRDDSVFMRALGSLQPRERSRKYDAIIVDECQDMRLPYFQFLRRVVEDHMVPNPQIVLLGSSRQVLYDFYAHHPADSRFLTMGDHLLRSLSSRRWERCQLTQSFRLTPTIARFVNHLWGDNRIVGANTRSADLPVQYLIGNMFSAELYGCLERLVTKVGCGNVVILVQSLESSSTRALVNYLSGKVLLHVPYKESRTDGTGKVEITTYHRFKGSERPVAIVMGFDGGGRNGTHTSLSHPLNVALTRASGGVLVVVHHHVNSQYPMLGPVGNVGSIGVSLHVICPYRPSQNSRLDQTHFPVTSLASFLEAEVIDRILDPHVELCTVVPAEKPIDVRVEVDCGGYSENVAAIYGTLIPLVYQFRATGHCKQIERILAPVLVKTAEEVDTAARAHPNSLVMTRSDYAQIFPIRFRDAVRLAYTITDKKRSDWGLLAAACNASHGFHHQLHQIKSYEWLDFAVVEAGVQRIQSFNLEQPEFEYHVSGALGKYSVSGFVDAIGKTYLGLECWEFKCSSSLSKENILQLATYVSMLGGGRGYLANLRTGEVLRVDVDGVDLFRDLLAAHTGAKMPRLNDDEFQQYVATTKF